VTTDTQQKYNSRAAQLYREKLSQAAAQAMRMHGDKLHIDAGNDEGENKEEKEEDFFSTNTSSEFPASEPMKGEVQVPSLTKNSHIADDADGAPDVSKALSNEAPAKPAPRKSTIGAKKAGGKKPGLGAKKGLGAQKVTKDFAEIEREAEMADNIVLARKEEARISAARTEEEQAASMASMRLAYQDLGVQQKKKEQALSKMDPKKAEQMERLGMGFGAGSGFGAEKSHSLISDMGIIKQEEPSKSRKPQFQTSTKDKFFDDFEDVENENDNGWGGSSSSRIDSICSPSNKTNKSAWEQDLSENISKSASKSASWDNDFDSKPKKSASPMSSGPAGVEAVSKFGNAKSISSDMFFGSDSASDRDANLNRFQGSNSISSDMYFNRETSNMSKSQSYTANMQAPDMEDVKESVRQGVTKVAGRLSGMASGVMNQIQDKYGY